MEFRKATTAEAGDIMDIIGQAQKYFREQDVDQWQNNYPNFQTIKDDIKNDVSYVLIKDGIIVGTVALIFGLEKTYGSIYNGSWKNDGEYATIHRMAISSEYKGLGLATRMFKEVEAFCLNKGVHSIRVDTHEGNLAMIKSLRKNGFKYCGIIYLEDNSKRLAFEKNL